MRLKSEVSLLNENGDNSFASNNISMNHRGSHDRIHSRGVNGGNPFMAAPANNGPSTPNDSAYFTGRFGLSKESRSSTNPIAQVLSGKHSMTDGTVSNY